MPFPQTISIPKTLMLTPKDGYGQVLIVIQNIGGVLDLGPGNGSKVLFVANESNFSSVMVTESITEIFNALN